MALPLAGARALLEASARVRERAISVVVKQPDEPGGQTARTAVHGHALPATVGVLAGPGELVDRGVEVIGDEQSGG
jgi:hypothetical protein